jgi:tRNA(Arg) A34 adenosine deaminase TadA
MPDSFLQTSARVLALAAVVLGACLTSTACRPEADRPQGSPPSASRTPAVADAEADEIRQLLAYAIVAARWDGAADTRVGHHIAAVLVAPDGLPVRWERNANFAEESAIAHAEARLIKGYIDDRRELGRPVPRLAGYTVYTTLEPCAMCVGIMIVADVDRVVYGQRDPRWGQAADRLSLDSRTLARGLPPYPRGVLSEPSDSPFRVRLEAAHRRSGGAVTEWLDSTEAEEIFLEAVQALQRFKPRQPANKTLLDAARAQYQLAAENRHR